MSSRHLRSVELLITKPDRSAARLQSQLRGQLLEAITTGRLTAGSRLPSTRQLAADLGVARGTVVEVYDQLVHEGFLTAAQGVGTAVAASTLPPSRPGGGGDPSSRLIDLRPGRPDLRSFPREIWARAASHVLKTLPDAELGDVQPMGASALRAELAPHLGRTRHLVTDSEHLAVTTGVEQGLALLCHLLLAQGHSVLAVEDPTDSIHRQVLIEHGLALVDVPVDSEGVSVDALRLTGARAVLVTPTPQFPTGVVMSCRRREALAAWAGEVDALIVELEADFQLRNPTVPSLQASLPQRVVHISSTCQTLVPGARLGWLAVPKSLRQELPSAVGRVGFPTSVFDQHTFAHLLRTGEYDRHIRRQRVAYRAQRTSLVNALAQHLPGWSVRGSGAGLHIWLEPHEPVDETQLMRSAELHGLRVLTMAEMRRTVGTQGLVLSFAQLSSHAAADTARSLADAVALCRTSKPSVGASPGSGRSSGSSGSCL
jgi:GntR family transcriptional regulator/MocR family aminotransferase